MSHSISPKASEAAISLSLVFIAFFALLLLSDAFKAPVWFDRQFSEFLDLGYLVQSPMEVMLFVGFFAVPLALWHLLEVFSKVTQESSKIAQFLSSYRPVLSLFIAGMIGVGLSTSGFAGWLSCYQPEPTITTESGNKFGFFCTPDPTYLAIFIIIPSLFALACLALAKLAHALFSRLFRTV